MDEALTKILYAEDEPDIRSIAQIALEDLGGFTVNYCNNGKEAIDAVSVFQPQLLLLDVMMPGMDGPTTLKEIRKINGFEHTPAIFMTAKIQPNEVTQYKALGVIDVISKPFDPITLAETIKNAWKNSHG